MASQQARAVRKATGSHYTPTPLAQFVSSKIVENLDASKASELRVLDPASGDGELLVKLRDELIANGYSNLHITGFDTNPSAVQQTSLRLGKDGGVDLREADFTQFALEHRNEGGLFRLPKFDVVIANPPYVRTQVMGADQSREFAQSFGLSGRVDLYHVFLSGIGSVLERGGVAGIIVSNRFMTTRGGADIRRLLTEEFEILNVFDLGDTRLFEAAVLPAVLVLRKRDTRAEQSEPATFTSIYSTANQDADLTTRDIFGGLSHEGIIQTETGEQFAVKQGVLRPDLTGKQVWSLSNNSSDAWLETVAKNTYRTFGEIGKIRVGVKTTSDKVFIRSDWEGLDEDQRPELLRPVVTHHTATRFRSVPSGRSIVYPHEVVNGKRQAVDISKYPRTENYLNAHRDVLSLRKYLAEGGRKWYEIWVPQNPDSWAKPKIVFRDIAVTPTFWMDLSGAVVNGDCYWMKVDGDETDELLWLALAVGNSTFVEAFYDHSFHNKLYSGRRRFMSQYVEKFPVPDPSRKVSQRIISATRSLYAQLDSGGTLPALEAEIDDLVWEAFGLTK